MKMNDEYLIFNGCKDGILLLNFNSKPPPSL